MRRSPAAAQVRRGDVLVMVGGEESAFGVCQRLFESFAWQVRHVGPSGRGAWMKLVTNLVLGEPRGTGRGTCLCGIPRPRSRDRIERAPRQHGLLADHGHQRSEDGRSRLHTGGSTFAASQRRPSDSRSRRTSWTITAADRRTSTLAGSCRVARPRRPRQQRVLETLLRQS